jgi:hypothetical protein
VVLRRWLNLRSKDSKFNAADDGGEQGMLWGQAFRFVFWCPETMPYWRNSYLLYRRERRRQCGTEIVDEQGNLLRSSLRCLCSNFDLLSWWIEHFTGLTVSILLRRRKLRLRRRQLRHRRRGDHRWVSVTGLRWGIDVTLYIEGMTSLFVTCFSYPVLESAG